MLIALVSTAVFFGAIGIVVVNSTGWPRVQQSFFDPETFVVSWPRVTGAFWVNVQLFLIAEVLVLVLGLVIAVLRSLPGAVMAPIRLLATAYVDLDRKSTRLNSSHLVISYAVFCLKKKRNYIRY